MNLIKRPIHIHFIGWALIFLLFWWTLYDEVHPNALFSAVIVMLCSMPVFYSHMFLLDHYGNRKKIGWYLAGLALIFLAFEIAFELASRILPAYPERFPIILFAVILSGVAKGIESRFATIVKRQELEKQSLRAELDYLKSQINPHFLFNTINNIHTLAYKNSPLTPEALVRLSSLMRYMLYESNADKVALSREIEYLKDYIDLQQLRYRNREIAELQIIGDAQSCMIAPLLLIHMLENAYKHSASKLATGDIKVSIIIKSSEVTFVIQNPIGKKDERLIKESGGIGLQNIQKRLHLIYPGQHVFETESSDGIFKVFLNISGLK